ncbi:glycosyltransferase family 9 protein [Gillisia sp. Hel_I_86]|uniref:glycosyltransferase family 9 protein n=1 Tax=Gillisia sp. Hel_I_86 TaxID=1249981 RepID=UPI0021BDCA90|nr:glycosyltransferase family 9 protein [Gillisia sp. Hel_I_86]
MIGDVLTSSILFEALRKEYPNAQLHYLVYAHTTPVLEHNPFIDQILHFDDTTKKAFQFAAFLKQVKKERYDAVIDVYGKLGSAITSKYSKANIRISFDKWYTKPFHTHYFSRNITAQTNAGPAIEKRLRLLNPILKHIPKEIKPKIYLTVKERSNAKEKLASAGIVEDKLLVMISVLGSTDSKTYPFKYLAQILDLIAAKKEVQLLFNYIPNQKEDALKIYNLCNTHTQNSIFLDVFGSDLREFLALTSHCDALIGNEGGAINMGKALDIPTFSIFSPGVPKGNWSIYENGRTNVSVHLKDYKPELFDKNSKKEVKKRSKEFYDLFQLSYFDEKLLSFINTISK